MPGADETLSIGDGSLAATFAPRLNMVCCSLRHEGEELLGLREGVEAYAEKGSTFGIPLLYPWANRLAAWDYDAGGRHVELAQDASVHADPDTGLPIHGLQPAELAWTVLGHDPGRLRAELDWSADERLLRAFPFPHRARYEATITDCELTIGVTVTPAGADAVPVSFGFHPYFELPGCRRADVALTLPVRTRGVADDRGIPTGETEPVAAGELDGPIGERTFDASFPVLEPEPRFALAGGGRRVELGYGPGFPVAQLYVPPGKPFLAVEPMTAPVNALRSGDRLRWVGPGSELSARFTVSVAKALG